MAKSIIDDVVDDQDKSHLAGRKGRESAKRRAADNKRRAADNKRRAKEKKKTDKERQKQNKEKRKHQLKMAKVKGKKKSRGGKKKDRSRSKTYPAPGKDHTFDVKATSFISNVYTKLQAHQPGYSPLGKLLEGKKWSVSVSKDGFSTAGIIEAGMFKQPLVIEAEYVNVKVLQKGDFLISAANSAASKKQFIAKCYVVAHIEDDMINALRAFRHPNFSPFFYDIDRDRLIYHPKETKTAIFAEWFKTSGRPMTIAQLIRSTADKDGLFTKRSVAKKLNLSDDEIGALFQTLIKKNIIVDVDKKHYTFV